MQQVDLFSKPCKNPLKLYPHYILESSSQLGRLFDFYQYCGVCRRLAFTDGNYGARQLSRYQKPFPDSSINPKSGPCSGDTL